MNFLLSSQNVFDYLIERSLCTQEEKASGKVELKPAKNFNLLLTLRSSRQLLVKQELRDRNGNTLGEFAREWRIHHLVRHFEELALLPWLSEAVYFDSENSIIVFNYLQEYRDVAHFYTQENVYPPQIAAAMGEILAAIHRRTWQHGEYQEWFSPSSPQQPDLSTDLERIEPEAFGSVPQEGLKFFALYQRYDSLGTAIAQLRQSFTPSCVTHNDLKLNNILVANNWDHPSNTNIIRIIDWERSTWGDPALDLGRLLASYLQLWLLSLITSSGMTIEESLRLATIPLETLQPSMAALATAYFHHFPEILAYRPDFIVRVIQFAGLALIQAIQATIQHQKSFGNTGICFLQVAKSLLCRPEKSISTVFSTAATELTQHTFARAWYR